MPQGGLEIPCVYTFTGVSAQVNKVKKLLTDNATIPEAKNTTDTYGDDEIDLTDVDEIVKKRKIEHRDEWVSVGRIHLTTVDKEVVLNGLELNDMILNASQQLLHQQFPPIKGLRSTLSPVTNLGAWVNNYLQIFHCRTNHWTTASTIGCHEGEVCVYDSLYTSVDDITKKSIADVFSLVNRQVHNTSYSKTRRFNRLRFVCHSNRYLSCCWTRSTHSTIAPFCSEEFTTSSRLLFRTRTFD